MRGLDPDQQKRVIGKAAWDLVESGVLTWDDVVKRTHIVPLRDLIELHELSPDTLRKAGVPDHVADRARAATETPAHELAAAKRRDLIDALKGKGLAPEEIRRRTAERLAGRVGIGGGPSGGSRTRRDDPDAVARVNGRLGVKIPLPEPEPASPARPAVPPLREVDYDDAARGLVREMFGRDLSAEEVGGVLGLDALPPGAIDRALIEVDPAGRLSVWFAGPDGLQVERVFRAPEGGPRTVDNEMLVLPDAMRGGGVGFEVFRRFAERASAAGFERFDTYAARGEGYNGYYTWARLGYDADLGPALADRARAAGLGDVRRVSDLMATPEGRDWWKANGTGLDMEFDLRPGSPTRERLDAYARARAEAGGT